MEEQVKTFLKAIKAAANAGKSVEEFAREHRKGNLASSIDMAERALRAIGDIAGLETGAAAMKAAIAATLSESRSRLDREKALLAGAVAKRLNEEGFKVSGNLPTLTAGPFSLEFTFGSKGLCTIWLGPGKYRLAAASLDPEDICAQIREQNGRLFPDSFDEPAFLAELEKAYRLAVIRTGAESGGRVPVTSLIPEIAFMRQKPAFLIDPRKETFRSYGRVEFAADLSRLRNRIIRGMELRLDVATMSQTRNAGDHLWVPRPGILEGVNFATLRFVKVTA